MSYDFVAIDFETANRSLNSACSIALVAVKDNIICDKYYSLIKPPVMKFDPINIKIHGITPDQVQDAPNFSEVWDEIKKYFNINNIIIAHNASFDMSVLKLSLLEYEISIPYFYYLCSIQFSNMACYDNVGNSLKDKAAHFGIPIENHHNALCDALTCAKIVLKSIEYKNEDSFKSYCYAHSDIKIKRIHDLNSQKSIGKKRKFHSIRISDVVPTTDNFNSDHPFYEKNIVLTGTLLTLDRKAAMQSIVNLGGKNRSTVTKTTDYLVVGIQDKSIVGEDGMSNKEEKAYALIEKGYEINIINEDKFIELLGEVKHAPTT